MRVVFMGTPDIAATCFKRIIADGFEIVGCYTQPDRPKGRGMKMVYSPVKEVAIANNIPVFQPVNFKDEETIAQFKALSVPGKYGLVKRPYYAKVRAQDRDGNWYEAEGEELIGRCFCHELDHLDGIIYTQVMDRFLTDEELEYDED